MDHYGLPSERRIPMAAPRFAAGQVNRMLTQVYEGMTVCDQAGDKIGTVEYVYLGELTEADEEEYGFGASTASALGSSEGSLIEEFARDVILTEQVPDTLRDWLLHQGFIRINSTGFFAADRYATPAQIASISNDHVMLRVSRNELIKA
jgi:hypothetical protein